MHRIFLTTFAFFFFAGLLLAQTDSTAVNPGISANPELSGPTSPILNGHQLEREKWFYSIDEAMREPQKVFKLSLKNKNMKFLPAEISRFPNLQILNLSDNNLKTLPDELSELEHLQVLILHNNRLRELPASMRELENLTQLYLGRNKLVEVPVWVGGFSRLRTLDLSFNHLTTYEIELVAARLPKCQVTH
ncbi:MAG: leucine-rich repeat domain-containing protein [Bacteroidia bacterium]|nr:leucine-rich repeat domain-containing protein [Bacteroidia bacterium]